MTTKRGKAVRDFVAYYNHPMNRLLANAPSCPKSSDDVHQDNPQRGIDPWQESNGRPQTC
jgi:hypothetical protein